MAFVYPNRTCEVTTDPGVLTVIKLEGEVPSFWRFRKNMKIGDETTVTLQDGTTSELLRVQLTAADQLTVLHCYDSSNGKDSSGNGVRINWTAGEKQVFATMLGDFALLPPASGDAGAPVVVQPDGSYGAGAVLPSTPGGLSLGQILDVTTDGTTNVQLLATWSAVASDVATYEVQIRFGKTSGWPGNASAYATFSAGGGAHYQTTVLSGYTYGVCVRARTASGAGNWSGEQAIAVIGDTSGPAKPTGVTTTPLFKSIRVDWTNPVDADFDRVKVWSNTSSDANSKTLTWEGRSSSFTHEVNATGTTRYYWLEALDVSGNSSGFTGPYSATTASLDATSFPSDLQPIKVVSALPTGAPADGITTVRYNSRLYKWNGSAWVDELSAGNISGQLTDTQIADLAAAKLTGQVSSAQIADAAITAAKFASGITPVEIVAVLPATGNFVGRTVTLTSDGKLYRYTASGWSAAVPASDIAGQLADAQVAAVSAGKVTGQLSNAQIADLAAAKLTGQLVASQIGSVAANTVTGQLTDAQIAALSAAKLTGQITSVQITDDAISTPKLNAGAVSADKIASSAVTADKIAANSVTTNALAAGSVTASKIVISPANICADPWFTDMNYWAPDVGGWFSEANNNAGNATSNLGSRTAIVLYDGLYTGAEQKHVWKFNIPYSGSGRTLRLRARALAVSTTQSFSAGIQFLGVDDSYLGGIGIGWEAVGFGNARVETKEASGVVPFGTTKIHFVIYNEAPGSAWAGTAAISDFEVCEAASSYMIVNGAVVSDKIAANAVTAGKIAADAVTAGTVAADAITAREIQAGAVTTAKLAAGAVVAGTIGAGAVTTDKLAANSVTAGKVAADAITVGTVAAGAISGREIAANAITARHLVLSDFENLVPDNGFLDEKSWVTSYDFSTAAVNRVTTLQAQYGWKSPNGYEFRQYEENATSQVFTVVPGDQYRIGFQGWTAWDNVNLEVWLFNVETNAWTQVGWSALAVNQVADYAWTYTVPGGMRRVRVHYIRRGSNTTANSQWATITAPFCRRLNGGELIVDGAITANKVASNAITTDKLSANAVTADKIAVNSVTASKVLIAPNNYCLDPFFDDSGAWFPDASGWVFGSTAYLPNIRRLAKLETAIGTGRRHIWSMWFPVDCAGQKVRLRATGYNGSNQNVTLIVRWRRGDGSDISDLGFAWAAGSGYAVKEAIGDAPADAAFAVFVLFNDSGTKFTGQAYVAVPQLQRRVDNSLIVDGGITADKLAANSVTTNALSAGAITTDKIAANAVTTAKMFVGDMTNLIPNANGSNGVEGWGRSDNGAVGLGYWGGYWGLTGPFTAPGNVYVVSKTFEVQENRQYFVRCLIKVPAGSTGFVCIDWVARDGSWVGNSTLLSGATPQEDYWVTGTVTVPGSVFRARFVANRTSGGDLYFSNPEMRLKNNGELIVDGSITTGHMQADTINGDRITTNTLHGTKVQAGTITGDRLALGFSKFDAIRVVGHSNNVNTGSAWGLYLSGTRSTGPGGGRGLNAWAYDRNSHLFIEFRTWDLYGNYGGTAGDMMNWLNSQGSDRLIIIASYDAVQVQDDGLFTALKRIGASRAVLTQTAGRWPYALIGWGGLGEGNGLEQKQSGTSTIPAEISTLWGDNTLTGVGGTVGPYTTIEPGRILVAGTQGLDGYFNGTEIDGGKVKANSVQGDRIIAGTMSGDRISAGSLTVDKLAVFSSGNLLAAADLSAGLTYWVQSWNQGGANVQRGIDGPDANWVLVGGHTLYLHQSDEIAGWYDVKYQHPNVSGLSDYVPVEPGKWVEFSAYTGVHRCSAHLLIIFDDADHNYIAEYASFANTGEATGGRILSQYKRLWVKIQVPANAASARIILRKAGTLAGTGDSWVFWTQPFFGYCAPNATEPQPWQPGGATAISGASITTGTIRAAQLVQTEALITNNAQLGDATVTTLKIGADQVTLPRSNYVENFGYVPTSNTTINTGPWVASIGQPILISVSLMHVLDTYSTRDLGQPTLQLEIQRGVSDGTTVTWTTLVGNLGGSLTMQDISFGGGVSRPWTYTVVDKTQGAGTFIYRVNAFRLISPNIVSIVYCTLSYMECRR